MSIVRICLSDSTPPQPNQTSSLQSPQLKTKLGKRTEVVLMNIWEPLDLLGNSLMGNSGELSI